MGLHRAGKKKINERRNEKLTKTHKKMRKNGKRKTPTKEKQKGRQTKTDRQKTEMDPDNTLLQKWVSTRQINSFNASIGFTILFNISI